MEGMGIEMKRNCWEFMRCGKGANVPDGGLQCPAYTEQRLHSVHGGINAGRACWVVNDTKCEGILQGTFQSTYRSCSTCAFYLAVRAEEGDQYQISMTLMDMLRRERH